MRIGVINWDASLPKDTYFGGFTHNTLCNEKYACRLPYFALKDENGYRIPVRSKADYDTELSYAINAGIDFFAYCWYPDSAPSERTVWKDAEMYAFLKEHYAELNLARNMYLESEKRHEINMCAIVFSVNSYSESDFEALTDIMGEDFYEKVDGRPLVMIFGGYSSEFIDIVRDFARKKGHNPYFAFIGFCPTDGADYSNADAVTAYASDCIGDFRQHTDNTYLANERRLDFGLPVIPLLSMGWNPMPRVEKPSPWVTYEHKEYAGQPTEEDIEYSFKRLKEFINNHPDKANTDHAIAFAWNEFEEGGYLCPTLGKNGEVNDTVLQGFARARNKIQF